MYDFKSMQRKKGKFNLETRSLIGLYPTYLIRPKKMSVSCNPTLTSFYLKKSPPKALSALPTPNQPKTCIKHTFFSNKKIEKEKKNTDLPTLYSGGRLQERNNFF